MKTRGCTLLLLLLVASIVTSANAQSQSETLQLTASQRSASRALAHIVDSAPVRRSQSLFADPSDRYFTHTPLNLHSYPGSTDPHSAAEQLAIGMCIADAVVVGTLSDPRPFLAENARYILTQYSLNVRESLKGPASPNTVVQYFRLGGKLSIQGRTVRVTNGGFPELEVDTPFILFLVKVAGTENGYTVPTGVAATWVVDAITADPTARGRSPVSRFELRGGMNYGRLRAALATARCDG